MPTDTTTNIDLIQKLIRLANNNPNDNEANLAARKVCKMLGDYKWGGISNGNPKVTIRPPQAYQPSTRQSDWYEEFFKGRNPFSWTGFDYGDNFTQPKDPYIKDPPKPNQKSYSSPKPPKRNITCIGCKGIFSSSYPNELEFLCYQCQLIVSKEKDKRSTRKDESNKIYYALKYCKICNNANNIQYTDLEKNLSLTNYINYLFFCVKCGTENKGSHYAGK